MPFHAMKFLNFPCHAMNCLSMPFLAMSCHSMHALPYHSMSCLSLLFHVISCHALLFHAMSCLDMPFLALTFHAFPCHAFPCHAIPCLLLALDQFLKKPWSDLTHFWTSTRWSKMEHLGGAEIVDLIDFFGLMGLWDVGPWGLPMIRPYCKGL
jgi:hypothetical protein